LFIVGWLVKGVGEGTQRQQFLNTDLPENMETKQYNLSQQQW